MKCKDVLEVGDEFTPEAPVISEAPDLPNEVGEEPKPIDFDSLDADEELLAHAPRPLRFLRRFAPFLARRAVANYRFNWFEQTPRPEAL